MTVELTCRALAKWGRGKPRDIRNRIAIICRNIRLAERDPHAVALRQNVQDNVERLRELTSTQRG